MESSEECTNQLVNLMVCHWWVKQLPMLWSKNSTYWHGDYMIPDWVASQPLTFYHGIHYQMGQVFDFLFQPSCPTQIRCFCWHQPLFFWFFRGELTSWCLIYSPGNILYTLPNALLKMVFLFLRGDMLVRLPIQYDRYRFVILYSHTQSTVTVVASRLVVQQIPGMPVFCPFKRRGF